METCTKRKLSPEVDERETNCKRHAEDIIPKISTLVEAVTKQGILGSLIVITPDGEEHPHVTLQNSLTTINSNLEITRKEDGTFTLEINNEDFACGKFQNIKEAKRHLAEEALKKLRKMCFFIDKKRDFVNITKENLQSDTDGQPDQLKFNLQVNSLAHKMMLNMGWSGGGLGAKEQGTEEPVMLYENVDRQGLGSNSLVKAITDKLDAFAKSSDVLTMVFDTNFTKAERAQIHKLANRFNLKSKSTGSQTCRKLMVSRKHSKLDIVKELLKNNGDDGLYKLHIPENFSHLWNT